MSDLIPSMSFTEFKKLTADQLRRLKCYEITHNCEYLFTFINGVIEPSGFMRLKSENMAAASNAVGGETLEEVRGAAVRV